MTVYNLKTCEKFNDIIPIAEGLEECVILCGAQELDGLLDIFHWDKSTALECVNLDETVRYTSYDGYDFVSLIHASTREREVLQREINIFFAKNYLVLVLPRDESARLHGLIRGLFDGMDKIARRSLPFMYYSIFNVLAADYSETLEALEDDMEATAETIPTQSDPAQLTRIGQLRKAAYTYKKILRALSYIGGQILVNENGLLDKAHVRYFRSMNTRMMKLYDFADNLYVLSSELLHTYDSKAAVRLNETMNKLTIITLFFGPLTVITGIYGMNFTHMPELDWTFGYPLVLGAMAAICAGIYMVMRWKKWL